MRHYSEADLLETYYTAPGESMPVMMHLAECHDCAGRYERLEQKLRQAAGSCSIESKPATFWSRQRLSIVRRIDDRKRHVAQFQRFSRIAAAALISFVLGGTVVWESVTPEQHTGPVSVTAASVAPGSVQLSATQQKAADESLIAHDAWQSDELSDFHKVVEWESWVPDAQTKKNGGSL